MKENLRKIYASMGRAMPRVELIAVGTELLLGQLLDTNTIHIAQSLAQNGVDVFATHTVGDNRVRIAAAIGAALAQSDGVVMTGGLGPTVDDLTKEAVCDALGLETQLHEPSLRAMEALFASFKREMRGNNRKQALLPLGAHVLENPNGTAPGFIAFAPDGKFVACMPGVPGEMKPMLAERLLPWLREHCHVHEAITTRVLRCVNIAESEVDHRIADLFASSENPKIAVLAHDARIDVKIMAKAASPSLAYALIAPLEATIRQRLHGYVYGVDGATLASAVLDSLRAKHLRIAVAESCTGGRIAAALTQPAGASDVFLGGIVAYENSVKTAALGISPEKLAQEGAVSEAVALAMASGVRERLGAQVGIASTGIAGPSGGTPEKPIGTIWLAVNVAGREPFARRIQLRGDRARIQDQATTAALGLLWNVIRE